jgi:DNA-binding response OmpR family regulator
MLREGTVPVVICERDLPDGDWKVILSALRRLEKAPLLIVCSRVADEYLWAEVLNLGGWDVLAKPFDAREVTWSVGLAVQEWQRRAGAGAAEGSQVAAG